MALDMSYSEICDFLCDISEDQNNGLSEDDRNKLTQAAIKFGLLIPRKEVANDSRLSNKKKKRWINGFS